TEPRTCARSRPPSPTTTPAAGRGPDFRRTMCRSMGGSDAPHHVPGDLIQRPAAQRDKWVVVPQRSAHLRFVVVGDVMLHVAPFEVNPAAPRTACPSHNSRGTESEPTGCLVT